MYLENLFENKYTRKHKNNSNRVYRSKDCISKDTRITLMGLFRVYRLEVFLLQDTRMTHIEHFRVLYLPKRPFSEKPGTASISSILSYC